MMDSRPAWGDNSDCTDPRIVERLSMSRLYLDYERAFGDATGLPLSLASNDHRSFEHPARGYQNVFFEWFARHHPLCVSCQKSRQRAMRDAVAGSRTLTYFDGLCESSVPIRTGDHTIGFLRTGEVATSRRSATKFRKVARHLRVLGTDFDEEAMCRAYCSIRVMSFAKYRSFLDLLAIFSRHLALIAGQLALNDGNSESPNIRRARQFIHEHHAEPLDLEQLAGLAHMSSCYFCRKFKESTGFTFTEYLARTRVEAAKALLLNPQVRITEVAFEVGFQSITHFNRVFKEVVGQCPTEHRKQLPRTV
jgi:AraC-like DNA-binding protein